MIARLLNDQRGRIAEFVVGYTLVGALAALAFVAALGQVGVTAAFGVIALGALTTGALIWFARAWARRSDRAE